jgi:hypothetical protein
VFSTSIKGALLAAFTLLASVTASHAVTYEYLIFSYDNKIIKKAPAWHGLNSGGKYRIYCNDSVRGRTFTTNQRFNTANQTKHYVFARDGNRSRSFCQIGPRDNF